MVERVAAALRWSASEPADRWKSGCHSDPLAPMQPAARGTRDTSQPHVRPALARSGLAFRRDIRSARPSCQGAFELGRAAGRPQVHCHSASPCCPPGAMRLPGQLVLKRPDVRGQATHPRRRLRAAPSGAPASEQRSCRPPAAFELGVLLGGDPISSRMSAADDIRQTSTEQGPARFTPLVAGATVGVGYLRAGGGVAAPFPTACAP